MAQFVTLTINEYCATIAQHKDSLLVFATDTLWGIGCVANDKQAIEQLYQLKIRDRDKPLMALLPDKESLANILPDGEQNIKKIIKNFLLTDDQTSGQLALVCPYDYAAARWKIINTPPHHDSVCFRVPHYAGAKKILTAVAKYKKNTMVVTSLNFSGAPPATTLATAKEFLQNLPAQQQKNIILLVDGEQEDGASSSPAVVKPSTVLSLLTDPPTILRPGALSKTEIERALGIRLKP